MNTEESIEILKNMILMPDGWIIGKNYNYKGNLEFIGCPEGQEAIETLLTAYEKEKEKNKKIDEFCSKELAFERRLKREDREPDEFNQGRFYVSENIRKIIEEE